MSVVDEGRELVRRLVKAECDLCDELAGGISITKHRAAEQAVEEANKAMEAWFAKLDRMK